MGMKVIWKGDPSYRRVLFRYGDGRMWRYWQNWKCNFSGWHWNIIWPFLRFTKCNGQMEIGLGNHYLELGW